MSRSLATVTLALAILSGCGAAPSQVAAPTAPETATSSTVQQWLSLQQDVASMNTEEVVAKLVRENKPEGAGQLFYYGLLNQQLQTFDAWAQARDAFRQLHEDEALTAEQRQLAGSDVSILITGATGSGKELLARAVHEADEQRQGPMVAINCGALPEQLLESELFGHVKGAFTGAISEHIGLFRAANGGTLFLDEIGDIPLPLQVKLLRALQERRIRPIGSTTTEPVDVRIISATNRDLERDMREGVFREDLFYRLNVINFHLPSLAERVEDIPLLANHFLRTTGAHQMGNVTSFAPAAMEVMISSPWPGNVRQLENVVQRTAALSTTPVIPEVLVREALTVEDQYLPSLSQARQQFEHDYLVKVLRLTNGSVAEAALLAQRNRTDFYKLLKRHHISPERFKEDS